MELTKKEYNKIKSLISKSFNLEFEIRLWDSITKKTTIDKNGFFDILKSLKFASIYGGLNLKEVKNQSLDIKIDESNNKIKDIRVSIEGIESIKKHWLNVDNDNSLSYTIMEKKRLEIYDLENYDLRFSISQEKAYDDKNNYIRNNLINDDKNMKYYRFKNRYSFNTSDGYFRYDLTESKSSSGLTFKKSGTINTLPTYEIEMEYIGNSNNVDDIFQKMVSNIGILLQYHQKSNYLVKKDEIYNILSGYNYLTETSNNGKAFSSIVVNPFTLLREHMDIKNPDNIINNYSVSYKADGQRNFLFVSKTGMMYLINNKFHVRKIGYEDKAWSNSLIEGEYVYELGLFLAYDMLFNNGKDIRKLNYISYDSKMNTRIKNMSQFISDYLEKINDNKEKYIKITSKKVLIGKDIFKLANDLWINRDMKPFNSDGLIFTPINVPYLKNKLTGKIFKWKPVHLNSIDFMIKTEKNNGKEIINIDTDEEGNTIKYKICTLFVDGGNSKNIVFNPPKMDDNISRAMIPLSTNNNMMAIDPFTGRIEEFNDGQIIEFVYNKNSKYYWKPIRVRHDKISGNYVTIANNNWYSIINNISINAITTGNMDWMSISQTSVTSVSNINKNQDNKGLETQSNNVYYVEKKDGIRSNMAKFHNDIKSQLFQQVAPGGGKILEFGSGKAGDIHKWRASKYAEVVGIELFMNNIKQANERYKNMKGNKPKMTFILGSYGELIYPDFDAALSENGKKIMANVMSSKYSFDTVSCQFSIHYLFKDEISVRKVLQNVTDSLKIGGYFIGTTFDGERVFNMLKNKTIIVGGDDDDDPEWTIRKTFSNRMSFNVSRPNYGKEISVYVKSIGTENSEYLVNFDNFDKLLREYGFEKVRVEGFAKIYDNYLNDEKLDPIFADLLKSMSEYEKQYSFLNNIFIYRKIKMSPDKVKIKLMNKIKKGKKKFKIKIVK